MTSLNFSLQMTFELSKTTGEAVYGDGDTVTVWSKTGTIARYDVPANREAVFAAATSLRKNFWA